jgi:hypothetical protein
MWEFAHTQKKKNPLPPPLFFRNLFFMMLYLHASKGVDRWVCALRVDENPVAVLLMPPDQRHAVRASRLTNPCTSIQDLDLCRAPALTDVITLPCYCFAS